MVQEAVLDVIDSQPLTVHVVWTAILRSDDRAAALRMQASMPDARVLHYWDADRSLGLAYKELVELPASNNALAWDVYFAFEAGTKWQENPPVPGDWWHQLARDDRSLRDGAGLRELLEN